MCIYKLYHSFSSTCVVRTTYADIINLLCNYNISIFRKDGYCHCHKGQSLNASFDSYSLLYLLQLHRLLEMRVISLPHGRCERPCRRPNNDRLGPVRQIAISSRSTHTLHPATWNCDHAWTPDKTDHKGCARSVKTTVLQDCNTTS